MVGVGRATPAQHPPSTPSALRFPVGQNFYQSKDMRVHYFWEEPLFQHPSESTPIGFRPWDTGRCSSPGTGPTCTKTGQLAVSINAHNSSNYILDVIILIKIRLVMPGSEIQTEVVQAAAGFHDPISKVIFPGSHLVF